MTELAEGIKLTCPTGYKIDVDNNTKELRREDKATGEYICKDDNSDKKLAIFVKFRSKFCIKNCVM